MNGRNDAVEALGGEAHERAYGPVRVRVELAGGRVARCDAWFGDGGESGTMPPALDEAFRRYFEAGEWSLDRFPVADDGLTAFQRAVYRELRSVPAGAVVTYGELAARVGRPRAARAVGTALARNPFLLFVPCHRVVAANGPGGWSGKPGLKEWLLAVEGVRVGR